MADTCGDNRFLLINACKKDFLENTNISDDEKKVLDSMCFRMWQLGLLKKYEPIDEEKLDKQARDAYNHSAFDNDNEWDKAVYCTGYQEGFKAKEDK